MLFGSYLVQTLPYWMPNPCTTVAVLVALLVEGCCCCCCFVVAAVKGSSGDCVAVEVQRRIERNAISIHVCILKNISLIERSNPEAKMVTSKIDKNLARQ